MKRLSALVLLVLAFSLAFVTTQAMAGSVPDPKKTPGPPGLSSTGTPGPGNPPGPPANPGQPNGVGPQNPPGAQATAHADQHGQPTIYRGTISALSANSLTIQLPDGSSVTIGLTPDTRIRVPGPQAQGDTLLVGMQVTVWAFTDSNNNVVARAVMAIPGKPVLAHRVGIVTAYAAGASITIQATDGNTYTFTLTAGTQVLPAGRSVNVGSRVTIIAPRDPSQLGWTATGIVVQP